jgi:heme/copper-type cytochrome/quinol oxidase subunit 2
MSAESPVVTFWYITSFLCLCIVKAQEKKKAAARKAAMKDKLVGKIILLTASTINQMCKGVPTSELHGYRQDSNTYW